MQSVALYQKGLWRNILEVLLGFQDISVSELLGKMLRLCRATRLAIADSPTLLAKLQAAREIMSVLTARNIDDIDVGLRYEGYDNHWLHWKDGRVKGFSALVDKLSCTRQLVLTFESDTEYYWYSWERKFCKKGTYSLEGERINRRDYSPAFFAPYCRCAECGLTRKYYGPSVRRVDGVMPWHLLGNEELVLKGHDIHAVQRELGYWLCTMDVAKAACCKDLEIKQAATLPPSPTGVADRRLYPYYRPSAGGFGYDDNPYTRSCWSYVDSCPHGHRVFKMADPCGPYKLTDGNVSCCANCGVDRTMQAWNHPAFTSARMLQTAFNQVSSSGSGEAAL